MKNILDNANKRAEIFFFVKDKTKTKHALYSKQDQIDMSNQVFAENCEKPLCYDLFMPKI